ncbi:MAG: radical SAM protein, partial [Firmicutes bacterium]|nr:radical SAM protein [Bacillota bacterium]
MDNNNQPVLISWNTTKACNLACIHCYRDAGSKEEDELSTGEGKKLLDDIAKSGFKIMILSGGEPLMRHDIYELINHASKLGLRTVLGTNGTLITEETALKLKQAGASRVGISLDSASEESHDEFRQQKGSFRQAIEGMKNCKKAGLPFQIHTTVRDRNAHEIEKITDIAVELGSAAHHIFFLVPTGRAKDIADEQLKAVEYEKLLHRIVKKQTETSIELKPTCAPTFMRIAKQKKVDMRFTRGCLTGRSYCVILPNGDVHPCPYLPVKVGNVREKSFDLIWKEAEMFCQFREESPGGKCG